MLDIDEGIEYKTFEGFVLEKQKTMWRYSCSSEVPISAFVRVKSKKHCHCGSKLVLLSYQYAASGRQSHRMQNVFSKV